MSQKIIDIHPNDGTGNPDTSEYLFGRATKGITIAYNLVVNINGTQFPGGYGFNTISDPTGLGYRVKQLQDPYGNPVTDIDVIRNYLKHMTGSNYVPEYNSTDPNDVFIYVTNPNYVDAERAWKYQYNSMTGLLVFGVDNFPFASKEYVQEYVAQHSGGAMPMRISFAYNFVVNSNGDIISGLKMDDATDPTGGGYTVKILRNSVNDEPIRDFDTIKDYMKRMTGVDFVPEYNQTYPQDTFIYLSSPNYTDENRVWKYQYTYNSTAGEYFLYAFKVNNFPFALKSEIPEQRVLNFEGEGIYDSSTGDIIYEINDERLKNYCLALSNIIVYDSNGDSKGRTMVSFLSNTSSTFSQYLGDPSATLISINTITGVLRIDTNSIILDDPNLYSSNYINVTVFLK